MTSGIGTLLHAHFHLRQQQAFERLLSNATGASEGISLSPRSLKSKPNRDEDRLDVNARDGFGRTVLHLASASTDASSVEYVRLLLKQPGINVNLQDWESQWTALHRALYVGNLGVVLLLLQHSSTDTTLKDLEGYTAFDLYNSTVEGTKPEPYLLPATPTLAPIAGAQLFTWGANRNASLGHGDSSDRTFPDLVSVPHPVIPGSNVPVEDRFARVGVRQVKMGKLHTAVISSLPLSTGSVGPMLSLCGFGSGGRLGVTQHTQYTLRRLSWASASSSSSSTSSRASAQTKLKVISVALGQDHTLALTENGDVYSWGLNRFAQLGYNIDDGSAAAQVFSLDDPSEFIPQSSANVSSTLSSNGERIQLVPRRVYGPLKKELVLGVAASKAASACWVRESGGGNVYTWGLNGGQLGYDRTSAGAGTQIQVLPRKVTKISRPVVQIALGESAMACLLSGAGSVGGKGDVLVFWGDQVGRVSFPTHTFPSPITAYRPPQTLKHRIVKVVCSDESPPPFSMSSLSSTSTATSTSGPSPSSSHKSASNLAVMLNSQTNSNLNTNQNHINFACVSEGGEVFVFGVPGVPPVGAFSGSGDGDVDGSGGSGSGMALARIIKPQRVWALRKGFVGAVRDVAIGVDGSLIVCTDSGHIYVRARSSASESTLGGAVSSKGPSSGGGKVQRFSRIPYLQRIVGVCANSTGAFGALRVDAEVKPIPWPAVDEVPTKNKFGRELNRTIDAAKGWDLTHDMKTILPWTWKESVESPLAREWLENVTEATARHSSAIPAPPSDAHAIHQEKEADQDEDDDGDLDIRKDIKALLDLCGSVEKLDKDGSDFWGTKLPHDADLMVFVYSGGDQAKKGRNKAKISSISFPLHSVLLGARSSTMSTALRSTSGSNFDCRGDGHSASSSISISAMQSTFDPRRRISFNHFHPLTVLVLMHYIYTDEILCIWDRRVSTGVALASPTSKITPVIAMQIKNELQTLAKTLSLPDMLKSTEGLVKRPVKENLRKDLHALLDFDNSGSSQDDPRPPMIAPNIMLQLAEGTEVFTYSVILRARSAYFEDFLGEEEWTKERKGSGRLLKVNMQHLRPRVMEYVMKWLCCGQTEGLFGALDFAETIDAVLEFLFEVIAVANELLLFPLVLFTSQYILRFLHIHNACYILSEASHYHAYDLVSSVEYYISENLETFLESHILDILSPPLVKHLSAFIRVQQERKASIVRSNRLVNHAMGKWQNWLESEDIPAVLIPRPGSLKRQRERKHTQALKFSTPPSPSPLSSTSFGHQKELSQTQCSPVIRPRPSISPGLRPQGPPLESGDIFDMDEMDIGLPSIDPTELHPAIGGVWKAPSVPRVDMRSVMAEAASKTPPRSAQVYKNPQARGSPSTGSPFNSVRLRRAPSSQAQLSSAIDIPLAPPSPSPVSRPSGPSPWKAPALAGQVSAQASSFPASSPVTSLTSRDPSALSGPSNARPSPQASSSSSTLGPVFTPSRQPAAKPQPTLPRRIAATKSSPKAWASAPVDEPLPSTSTNTTGKGMSFLAIQQLQIEHQTSNNKDKRSLLEIQQEEQAKREEEEFLKWWQAEEEKVRLEAQEMGRQRSGGEGRRNENQHKKSKKTKGTVSSGSREQESSRNFRQGPKSKGRAPPALAS